MPHSPRTYQPPGAGKARKDAEKRRGNSTQRGYGSDWKGMSESFRKRYPLCAECIKAGIVTQATEVDHIIPHRGNEALRMSVENLQSLCKPCHSRKTALYDGAFGRERHGG